MAKAQEKIAGALTREMLHGLMSVQTAELAKASGELSKLCAEYKCEDFNNAYAAFSGANKSNEKAFIESRNKIIEKLKSIVDSMSSIEEAQG